MKTKSIKNVSEKRGNKFAIRGLFFIAFILLSATALYAEGFRNPPPGTFDLGRAGGRIAQVDDSSAVQQNPANLVDITNFQAQLSPSIVYIGVDYEAASGRSASTTDPWKLLPNFFASAPLNDRVALGFGMSVPYGLSMQWDRNSSAFQDPTGWRYQTPYYTALTTINFNPSVSFRICDSVSIGAGVDVTWSQLTLKQFYPWFAWGGTTDGAMKAEGDGFGYGGNIGLTWKITDHQRLAITYRSPMDISYNGDFRINNFVSAAAGAGASPQSSFNTKIKYPTIVAVGYGIEITDRLRLESDFEYIEFSRFKTLNLNFGNNNVLFTALGKSTSIPENWHDTFTAGIAGDYLLSSNWVVRAGYQYYMSPVPDSTFSPTIPDADQNVITIGMGYKHGRHSFEAAYGLDFYNTRHINNDQNPAFNGKYNFDVHLFSLAYRYSF
jgi:long-chain fatty acid transport protein